MKISGSFLSKKYTAFKSKINNSKILKFLKLELMTISLSTLLSRALNFCLVALFFPEKPDRSKLHA
jgi:hypothetical protein